MADGGGGGGGGGGYNGGAGGPQTSGDNGAFSGSNGADLLPSGFVSTSASNAGGPASAGGSGSINIIAGKLLSSTTQTVVVTNSGNGANLILANVTFSDSSNASGISGNVVGYNFSTFTGNNVTFTLTAANLSVGVHNDTMTIGSNAINGVLYQVPLNITVLPPPNGTAVFTSPGITSFVVPADVHSMDISVVGGGGGAGGSYSSGSAGAVTTYYKKPVTPGETMSIYVGSGGSSTTLNTVEYYPVSLSYAWSSFMNSFAVWSNQGDSFTSTRMFVVPTSGNYTFEYQADNYLAIYVDGSLVGTTTSYQNSTTATVALAQGNRALSFTAQNYGGPAGFAVTIKNGSGTIVWSTLSQLSPNLGKAGETSTISASFGTLAAAGGAANNASLRTNGFRMYDGDIMYGPYGSGTDSVSAPGAPGAVLLTWGGGDSKNAFRAYPQSRTVTSPGYGSGGRGPSGDPGTQYSITGGNPSRTSYAPVSRYWVADSTNDSSFAWTQGIGFINPNSTISADELRAWGFDPSDVIPTTEATLKRFAAGVDSYFSVGHATLVHGDSGVANARNITTIAALSDQIADRHYRSSDGNPYEGGQNPYGLGPWSLPAPGPNEFIYLWVYDDIGTDSRSITVTFTA